MPAHLYALPAGHTLIGGDYVIEGELGAGGFGLTYLAMETATQQRVAIKEYLPSDFAVRGAGAAVQAKSADDAGDYQWGLARFADEARALARFDHPHLNQVYRYFEENNTAYMALEYIEGETLSAILKREKTLPADHLRQLIDEILSGLAAVHAADFVHRDIKPSNIIFRPDGRAVLLDFGAARQAISQKTKTLTAVLTPGYAPVEQYARQSANVGAWSDLYALGMVAYRCLIGRGDAELPDAVERQLSLNDGQDCLSPAATIGAGNYPPALLSAIDAAIQIDHRDRPADVAVMRALLAGTVAVPEVGRGATVATATKAKDTRVRRGSMMSGNTRARIIAGTAVVVIGTLVAVVATSLDEIQWLRVDCADEAAVNAYQQQYPEGRYRTEAAACLTAIAEIRGARIAAADDENWARVDCDDESDLLGYQQQYPEGRHRAEAEQCLTALAAANAARRAAADAAYWSGVDCADEAAVRDYLRQYPNGRYRGTAGACLASIERGDAVRARTAADEAAWAKVNCNKTHSIMTYLDRFPDGVHSEEAYQCLTARAGSKIIEELFRLFD